MNLTQRGSGYAVDSRLTLSVTEDMDTGFDFPTDDTIDVYAGGQKLLSFAKSLTGASLSVPTALTTDGKVLDLSNADALQLGTVIDVHSNSGNSSTRSLVRIVNDNATATGARCLELRNDSTSTTFILDHNGTSGQAMAIDSEQQSGEILDIAANTMQTGIVLAIDDADALALGGTIAKFWSNSGDTQSRALVRIGNDNNLADATNCLEIHQDGAGAGILFSGSGGSGIDFAAIGVSGAIFNATATTDPVTANPETNPETGWIKITIGGVARYIPFYTA